MRRDFDGRFAKLCDGIGAPELARDQRFAGDAPRNQHSDELARRLEAQLAAFGEREALTDRLVRAGRQQRWAMRTSGVANQVVKDTGGVAARVGGNQRPTEAISCRQCSTHTHIGFKV